MVIFGTGSPVYLREPVYLNVCFLILSDALLVLVVICGAATGGQDGALPREPSQPNKL